MFIYMMECWILIRITAPWNTIIYIYLSICPHVPLFSCGRLLSDISRLETKVERLESVIQAKDREIATITRTVQSRTSLNSMISLSNLYSTRKFFPIRKPKLRQLLKLKLTSYSRRRMSFREWLLAIRLG